MRTLASLERAGSDERRTRTLLALIVFGCTSVCAHAETTSAAEVAATEADDAVIDELTVTGRRVDMTVSGGLAPEVAFDAPVIRSLGASSLEELIEELAPEVSSGRGGGGGRPAFLVNGRRIANFREIRGYPPEAVERIEVYPEEVALRHGFRADQKVVNVILRRRFRALEIEAEAGAPRSGAGEAWEGELARLQLDGDQRFNLELSVEGRRPIHESDREIVVATRSAPTSEQGNLRGIDGGELDPALSRLAGEPVTSASLPLRMTDGPLELETLLATANAPVITDQRKRRTLQADTHDVNLAASYARPFGEALSLSVTGTFEDGRRIAELGVPGYTLDVDPSNPFSPFANTVTLDRLDATAGVLERRDHTRLGALDVTVTGGVGALQWSWLTELERSVRDTDTDRGLDAGGVDALADPFGAAPLSLPGLIDRRTATSTRAVTQLLANGPMELFDAGPARFSAALRYRHETLASRSGGSGGARQDSTDRGSVDFRGSMDAPLVESRRFGRLGANLNAEFVELSDFGSLRSLGAGLTWRPVNAVRLILSFASEEAAPSIAQLGDPLVAIPNQRIFDFARGESVTVTRLEGGNPDLDPEERRFWRMGLRLEPFDAHDVSLNLDFLDSTTDSPIIGFPTPTEEIEAAFGDRFERDANGELLSLDARPLNVQEARERRLDWGLRYVRRIGVSGTARSSGSRRDGGASRRGRGFGRRGDDGGRFYVSLQHGWSLEDRLLLSPGVPAVDYVGRSVGGRQRGGAEHVASLRASLTVRGTGGRVRLRWRDGTTSLPASDGTIGLRTSALTTLDVRAFHTVRRRSALAERLPWLAGARLTIGVDNAFGEKARVVDGFGATPAGSSADELDPVGRFVYVEFRRLVRGGPGT